MKNIVVTGASRGIGFQVSKILASQGNTVFAIARSKTALEQLAKEQDRIKPIVADLTTQIGLKEVSKKLSAVSKLDVLINNAATLENNPFIDSDIETWRNLFEVNVFSLVQLIQQCIPRMATNSHILNIGSMGGVQGSKKFAGLSAYSVSKGAVAILTECLALELSSENISVNCLALGAVSTEMQQAAFPDFTPPISAKEMATFISDFALNGHTFINGKILPISLSDPE